MPVWEWKEQDVLMRECKFCMKATESSSFDIEMTDFIDN